MRTVALPMPRSGLVEDVDLGPDGSSVAAVRAGTALRIVAADWELESPSLVRFPRVRVIDAERVLLVDSRTEPSVPNAWILDRRRGVVAHFLVGDAVADVVVHPPFIAVTYFDEAYASEGPGGEGASFFDVDGHFLWGYRAQFGDEAVDMMDVYAACTDEAGYLWFYPYTKFPLVRLDIHAREQLLFTPLELLHGSHALTIRDSTAFFAGPYERQGTVFEWPLNASDARRVGTIHGRLRGIPGGRFIAHADGKWNVVDDLGGSAD